MLRKGILARADDPTRIAAYNRYSGDPAGWFDNEFFRNNHLFPVTFDFFVDWKNKTIGKQLWTKRIIYQPFEMTVRETYQKIVAVDGMDHLDRLTGFCNRYHFELEYILCPEIPAKDWARSQNHVFIFNLTKYLNHEPDHEVLREVTAAQLKQIIGDIRRESHFIGKKGLTYASSSLEVYLSWDKYIYPGDADIVLINDRYEAVAIVEIKKHTAYSEKKFGPVESENLYSYRDTDRLKFQSLGWLKEDLDCSLYMLYYSTLESGPGIVKFERIVGDPEKLLSVYPFETELPEGNNSFSLMKFQKEFLRYHSKVCRYDFDRLCLSDSFEKGVPISRASAGCLGYILHPRNTAPEKRAVAEFMEYAGGHI